MKKIASASPQRAPFDFDIDNLLHPARAFGHPRQVVEDPDLTLNEKRAILASWASDACAIEAAPDLRAPPSGRIVRFDEITDALRALDEEVNGEITYRRVLRRQRILGRGRRDTSAGGTALQ